jgi:protocatechuate 3,4-dioxygenase beta subunit
MSVVYSRRHALWLSAGLLVACRDHRNGADASAPPLPVPPLPVQEESGDHGATPTCIETHANIEGPYYRANAPVRSNLVDPGTAGTPVEIEGRVSGLDCDSARGLANVELDVWHATHDGHYDNDGTMRLGDRFLLRGRLRTDADGRYKIKTIVPGRYLNGRQYRPAHVHVKLRASGFAPLTTQLYFPGDPYNDVDPFIHRSLIMNVEKARAGLLARFDFALRPA